jgi:hypothetical protein
LARQQQLGGQGVGVLLEAGAEAIARFGVVDGAAADRHPLLQIQHLIGAEADGEAIEQVITHRPLLGVVGGDQQTAAGMTEAEALALDPVFTAAHRRQQQVGDVVVEQVELIHIEHPPVRFRQQTGLKHGLAAGQRGGDIHRSHQTVFGDAQGHLHEGGRDHLGGQQGRRIAAAGVSAQGHQAAAGGVIPVIGATRIDIQGRRAGLTGAGRAQIEHIDRRQQGVQAAGQHRFAGAAATSNHHAPEAGVDRRQQQRQLQRAVAGDGGQREGAGGAVAADSAGNHGRRWAG